MDFEIRFVHCHLWFIVHYYKKADVYTGSDANYRNWKNRCGTAAAGPKLS